MRPASVLICLSLACCATPPRVDDRTSPEQTWRTFVGAVAREETRREHECLSDGLRARLGVPSHVRWSQARAIALDGSHLLIRGIRRYKVKDPAVHEGERRARLLVRFPFGYRATIRLISFPVLRIRVEGWDTPVYALLPALELPLGRDFVAVRIPAGLAAELAEDLEGEKILGIEARREWFIDDFEAGEHTPATIQGEIEDMERTE